MTRKTLKDVRALAKKMDAKVLDEKIGESHSCSVEAPKGTVWKGSGLHEMVDSAYRPYKPDYGDLYFRMAYGVEPCNNPDCEWCNDECS